MGAKLASLLGCDFVDLDCYIADKAGRSSPAMAAVSITPAAKPMTMSWKRWGMRRTKIPSMHPRKVEAQTARETGRRIFMRL